MSAVTRHPGATPPATVLGGNAELALDSVSDLVFVLDTRGQILFANRAAHERLGWPAGTLVGQHVSSLHPSDRLDEVRHVLDDMLAGRVAACGIPLRGRDGRDIPVETSVVRGQWDGQPALIGVSRDISRLRLSEEKFEKAFNSSPAAMAITDRATGVFLDVNQTFLDTVGYARDEVVGRTAGDLKLFTKPGLREEILQALREQGSVRTLEVSLNRRDGAMRTGLFGADLLDVGGETRLLTTWLDVTERLAVEAELRENRNRLALIIDATGVGTWDWNLQTDEVAFNERWAEIAGYTLEELQPVSLQTWIRLCHPNDLDTSDALLKRHFAGEFDHYELECRMRHKEGHWVWIQDRGRVVARDADGRPVRMTGTHTDITALKQEETRRLALERNLQRAQKAESLDRMAGAIAHHFNNKLAVVLGHLDLARQLLPDGSDARGNLDEAFGATRTAAAINRLLLEYLGHGLVRRESVDLSQLCLEVAREFGSAEPTGIRIDTSGLDPGLTAHVDRARFRQVLVALVTNAREAFGDRTGEIRLSTGTTPGTPTDDQQVFPPGWTAAGPCQFVAVEDTGPGIDAAAMNHLFDPFYTTKFLGRGLGLPVALGHLRPYGGAIAVTTRPGHGSTFRVLLPLETDDAPQDEPPGVAIRPGAS